MTVPSTVGAHDTSVRHLAAAEAGAPEEALRDAPHETPEDER
jgi:hypothetical protein